MKLLTKVKLFRSTSWALTASLALPVVAMSALFGWPLVPMLILATAVFFAVSYWVPGLLVRRAHAQLNARIAAEDFGGARSVLADLREVYSGSLGALERFHYTEALILSREERHAEACRVLESLDPRRLGPTLEPWLKTNLAWSLVHSGRTEEAVKLARESLAAEEPSSDRPAIADDLRAHKLGTLGAALVMTGDAAAGVPLLEQALARGGRPLAQAARAFYLGEGLRALGRDEEARAAYTRAAEAAPQNAFGKRAKSRADDHRPYR
jgi:tetratricopeptide (TPR) repeat protein